MKHVYNSIVCKFLVSLPHIFVYKLQQSWKSIKRGKLETCQTVVAAVNPIASKMLLFLFTPITVLKDKTKL